MQVLEDHQQRLLARQRFELAQKRPSVLPLRCELTPSEAPSPSMESIRSAASCADVAVVARNACSFSRAVVSVLSFRSAATEIFREKPGNQLYRGPDHLVPRGSSLTLRWTLVVFGQCSRGLLPERRQLGFRQVTGLR